MDESTPWRRSGLENIHLDTGTPNSRRRSKGLSWRIRRVSTSTTSWLTSGCLWSDKRFLVHVGKLHLPPSRWTKSQTLLAERRIIPYSTSPELHTQTWMLRKNAPSMIIGISMDQQSCPILGQVSFSLLYWMRNLQTDMCGQGGDWQNGKLHPGQIIYGQNSGRNWKEMQSRSKNGQLKNQSSIMPENYEEFISLTLRTRSLKKPLVMLGRNWKHQWLPLCFARHARRARTAARLMISNQNLRVSWKPVNPRECVQWDNSLQHYNLVHKFFLCTKPWKSPQQKQQWIKSGRNLKRFPRGTWQKSEVIRGDRWSMDEGRKSSFRLTDGHLSFEKCRIGGKAPKIQRLSCTPRWHCKRQFGVLRSIHWTRVISSSNDGSKSHGYHVRTARLRRTSSLRSIC